MCVVILTPVSDPEFASSLSFVIEVGGTVNRKSQFDFLYS